MDWSHLQEDYERLGSWAAVAREYGVTKGAVSHVARARGLSTKSRSRGIDWSDLPTLYASGMSIASLAARYECSVHAVQDAMVRLGIKARRPGLPAGYEWTEERRRHHREAIDRPEWRAKSRENLLRRLPSMRGPSANSPLEQLLQAALLAAGISFETQVRKLDKYVVDIEIVQAPIILEADGALHRLRKVRDAARDADLVTAGYTVHRFTGTEINRDPSACIERVIAAHALVPDREPKAIIRNGMVGSNNPHWDGGRRTLTCQRCGRVFVEPRRAGYARKYCGRECQMLARSERVQIVSQSELHGDVQS